MGNHAAYVKITHANGSFEMDATRFRLGLKLRSTAFECRKEGDEFVFDGSGWGHGVGMCQFGVNGLAKTQRYDAVGILQYYFQGARVMELWR